MKKIFTFFRLFTKPYLMLTEGVHSNVLYEFAEFIGVEEAMLLFVSTLLLKIIYLLQHSGINLLRNKKMLKILSFINFLTIFIIWLFLSLVDLETKSLRKFESESIIRSVIIGITLIFTEVLFHVIGEIIKTNKKRKITANTNQIK